MHRLFFDWNNLAMRLLHMPSVNIKTEPRYDFLAYLIFDNIYTEALKLAHETDKLEVILACDAHDGYWRKEIYPPYKADRVRSTDIDWETAYAKLDNLKKIIAENTPWKVITVPHCEADDIIAVLSRASTRTPCTVFSGDSDYLQLVSDNIRVFNPHYGEYVEFPNEIKISNGTTYCEDPEEFLALCILTGQGGKDNVYNVKTPTDFVKEAGKRKPPLGLKGAIKILDDPEEFEKYSSMENYERNKNLIDFSMIPYEIKKNVVDAYKNYPASAEPNVVNILTEYDWPSYRSIVDELDRDFKEYFV